jgi:hypothetical protein
MRSGNVCPRIHTAIVDVCTFRYCIPTDNARLQADAEIQFFDKIDPNGGGNFSQSRFLKTDRVQCQ